MVLNAAVIGGGISGLGERVSHRRARPPRHAVRGRGLPRRSRDDLPLPGRPPRALLPLHPSQRRRADRAYPRARAWSRSCCGARPRWGSCTSGASTRSTRRWTCCASRPLTFLERLRMGLLGIRARYAGLDPTLDQVTAADWIRGMVGRPGVRHPVEAAALRQDRRPLPGAARAVALEPHEPREEHGARGEGLPRARLPLADRRVRAAPARTRRRRSGSAPASRAIERDGERMALRARRTAARETFDFVVCDVAARRSSSA